MRKERKGIAAEKNWTRDEIETLITLWEGNEILYNVSLSDYLNKDKKSAAVKQIAEQLETNEENVSKKMASLKSYYCQLRSQYKHGTIIRTGITCKKIPCYMPDSACRWFIIKKVKIF